VSCNVQCMLRRLPIQKSRHTRATMTRNAKPTWVTCIVCAGWKTRIRYNILHTVDNNVFIHTYFIHCYCEIIQVQGFTALSVCVNKQEDLKAETLQKQFEIVKKETNESHVMEYGDLVSHFLIGCHCALSSL
jgi:hypothetical protein